MAAEKKLIIGEREFGTSYLEEFSPQELEEEAKKRLKLFFDIDYNDNPPSAFEKEFLKLLQIIQYGKEKYPFVVALDFDIDLDDVNRRVLGVKEISIWPDPHFADEEKEIKSLFNREVRVFPDLIEVKDCPHILINGIRESLAKGLLHPDEFVTGRVCLAGTNHSHLVVGYPKRAFFESCKNPKYVVSTRKHF